MLFDKELNFEKALIAVLSQYGWEEEVIRNPSEEDLIDNWATILFNNNRDIDRLNNQPLTKTEMRQIIEQVNELRTPLKLNGFINGKSVTIRRDNPADLLHLGKEVSLKIYDRREIAAGQSRYQIVSQPRFKTPGILNDRRGDIMLLINGMPLFHIELKKTGIPISQAANQLAKYSHEKVYRGIFSLVQIMVAMNPEETIYFANPGEDNIFNPNYYFNWANFNNEPINDWKQVASTLLSIPMAHQLIGFYTVADNTDGLLKVMRSYQYYAASAISDKVSKTDWAIPSKLGGYIWHTTGSGKTLTSFKSAELIANSQDADKVIFLVDRIELGTQSLREYRNFAADSGDIQATENTDVLVNKLKSSDPKDILIVTSIQKMSRISEDADGLKTKDIEVMKSKRIVIIVDECHRSTFGDMLLTIKSTFSQAIFFGFTGTPIFDENGKKDSTTVDVFGDELHRYSIADGIRDKNVLGFDPYKVTTFKDSELRRVIALEKAKCSTESEVFNDPQKEAKYYEFYNKEMPTNYVDSNGNEVNGIEYYIPTKQYQTAEHRENVVKNILDNWISISRNSKFHAIFATASINEAIAYYRLFKSKETTLNVVGLFDPNIDNVGNSEFKEDGLVELIEDYNKKFGHRFTLGSFDKYKKDIASRLAHKTPYIGIEKTPEKQIDILIVVNQMLTGFDSKWINTLYVDKKLEYENIIQAFSRTNRLFGSEKPFGTIKYYRYPHTMEKNIEKAIKMYSGDKPLGLFVDKIETNIENMNIVFQRIKSLFSEDFTTLPEIEVDKAQFAKLFRELSNLMESSKVQGFEWKDTIVGEVLPGEIHIAFTETEYQALLLRYKELSKTRAENEGSVPYDIDGYLIEVKTGEIDTAYMNSNFTKYLKALQVGNEDYIKKTLRDLHSSFSTLTSDEQKHAELFLRDIQRGEVLVIKDKTLREYITEYMVRAKNNQIRQCVDIFDLNEEKLRNLIIKKLNMDTINEFGKFDELKESVDKAKAKEYFDKLENKNLRRKDINQRIDTFLRKFVIEGGFEIRKIDE